MNLKKEMQYALTIPKEKTGQEMLKLYILHEIVWQKSTTEDLEEVELRAEHEEDFKIIEKLLQEAEISFYLLRPIDPVAIFYVPVSEIQKIE